MSVTSVYPSTLTIGDTRTLDVRNWGPSCVLTPLRGGIIDPEMTMADTLSPRTSSSSDTALSITSIMSASDAPINIRFGEYFIGVSEGVRRMIGEWCADDCALMTVAICLNLTRQSIAASMYLPECVRERGIPVLLQQRITSGIIENLAGGFAKDTDKMLRFSDLRPFGMLNDCLELDASPDVKARRVHYVYSTYDVGKGCLPQPCPSDEEVDALWEELKKERVVKQWSNIYCADSIAGKLRSVGHGREEWDSLTILAEREVDLLAQVEHNRWNVEELLLGYRPVTLKEQAWVEEDYKRRKKEMRDRKFVHYDIRDYSLLREESRAYDAAIVRCIPFVLHGRM